MSNKELQLILICLGRYENILNNYFKFRSMELGDVRFVQRLLEKEILKGRPRMHSIIKRRKLKEVDFGFEGNKK